VTIFEKIAKIMKKLGKMRKTLNHFYLSNLSFAANLFAIVAGSVQKSLI